MTDDQYFADLQKALTEAGHYRPVLIIDKQRLDANIDYVRSQLGNLPLRLVDKSLPVPALLSHLMQTLTTRRVMSFHLTITRAVLKQFPDSEILFGKPMPAGGLRQFLQAASSEEAQLYARNIVHLVDSAARLSAYCEIAHATGLPLRFAAEIDVGMHRGGFDTPASLRAALDSIRNDPRIKCEGLMGYEAHIPKIPGFAGGPEGERERVAKRFQSFMDVLDPSQRSILNTGGSKTAIGYSGTTLANEVSMGSAFLLPTDFDGGELSALKPALFIATPVLKVVDAHLPGPGWLTTLMQRLGRFPHKGCYTYGGKWMARPAYPADLRENALWGSSSNQQFYALSQGTTLTADDFAFFRPTQSEAVLQQFGPVLIYDGSRIADTWVPLPLG